MSWSFSCWLKVFPTSLPTIVPIVTGCIRRSKSCMTNFWNYFLFNIRNSWSPFKLLVLPWSVAIPRVVYLFTCSIDLKPSLNSKLYIRYSYIILKINKSFCVFFLVEACTKIYHGLPYMFLLELERVVFIFELLN